MGQAFSSFLIPGLPSCYGGSWPMLVAAKAGDHKHLAAATAREPLLLLACSPRGQSLLHVVAGKGDEATLGLLLHLIASHALSARLATLMEGSDGADAAVFGRSKLAPQLLQPEGVLPALLSWTDSRGVTPLMLAARGGHAGCLRLLLQAGADPLALDGINRRSCLHYAACCGHQASINVLLNAFHTVQQGSSSSSEEQQQRQQPRRVVLLQDATVKDAYGGTISFVDLRTRSGLSALHYAAFWGATGCATALLAAGASINSPVVISSRQQCELPIISGSTALHLAAENGHTSMVALLLHAHLVKMSHMLPRQTAPSDSLLERLPWEGTNSHHDPRLSRNDSGDTPLHLAVNRRGCKELLQLLLDPAVPISWALPGALESFFGGPPRIGVPQLATLAKAALDHHLSRTLEHLDPRPEAQGAPAPVYAATSSSSSSAPLPAPLDVPLHRAAASDNAGAPCRAASCSSSSASSSCGVPSVSTTSSASSLASCRAATAIRMATCSKEATDGLQLLGPLSEDDESASFSSCSSTTSAEPAGEHTCSICFDAAANVMVAGCSHFLCGGCARSLVAATTASKPALCPFCRTGMGGFLAAPLAE